MRRFSVLIASFAFLAGGAARAEPLAWSLSPDRMTIRVESAAPPIAAELRLAGRDRGPALAIETAEAGAWALVSDWPLMRGQVYDLALTTASGERLLRVAAPPPGIGPAQLARVTPNAPILPENLLRLHIHFTAPMARGQARRRIRLIDKTGRRIDHAFLNLGVELWSKDHRRLTLMFDPGRLKQGVGPNVALGAPLRAGRRYAIEIDGAMVDAYGRRLAQPHRHWFEAGSAERRAVAPALWDVVLARGILSVRFDRPMDAQSIRRALAVRDGGGWVAEAPTRHGASWRWAVDETADPDSVRLVVGPAIEDVAGNTLCAPFDAAAGAGVVCRESVEVFARRGDEAGASTPRR